MRYQDHIIKASRAHRRRTVLQAATAAGNWWEGLGVPAPVRLYQPKGAADQAASYIDLIGNANAGVGIAPTWDPVNGWKLNGVNQYLTTNFVPANDQSQSVMVQFTNVTNGGYLFGQYEANARWELRPNIGAAQYSNGGAILGAGAPLLSGNLAVAGSRAYRNGIDQSLALPAYGAAPILSPWIGDRSGLGNPCAAYIQILILWDVALTGAQVLTMKNAAAAQ